MPPPENNLRPIEEIPLPYRSVFQDYPCFNLVQSAVLDEALKTDNSIVVSAPTGSGKTAIFEMAVIRLLGRESDVTTPTNKKIVYISPVKALCKERLVDWHKKFSNFGVRCISITGDTDEMDARNISQYNLIITTPEKWDVLTRRWRENITLIGAINLFLIDEVHLLNADSRGSTLEVIVSRMKTTVTAIMLNEEKTSIRFVALSATIPNIEDIAEWIGPAGTAKYFKFSEDARPVKLNKIVLGYYHNPQNQSVFKFDMSMNYKLPSLISKYSDGKPTLIFCNTRKSVEMTATHLVANLQVRLTQDQKDILMKISQQLSETKLRQNIVHGIAFHHAGMAPDNRFTIEESFRKGHLPVLVTTSTLAMGVNLPAHLVIVKSTKCYSEGGYKDYDEVSIFQMIGRAGRCQFDRSATALILTSLQDKGKYEQMLACTQTIESNLHKHLTEHLNAEVVLRTITDLEVAMRWLSSTFLYVRARKSPEKYKLPVGLSKDKIDKKLLDMCQIDLNKLVSAGMIKMNQAIEITPTVVGGIMAKYYVAFETMKLFTQISGSEILIQILALISKCKEFSKIYLRTNDKKCLNLLNKSAKRESNRFPLTGRIKTVDMKINVIIQAVLGNLEISDQSIVCDSVKIMQNCERLARCLIEYLETRDKCYNALLNTIILAKCFRVKLWENSPYVSKQLTGVGQVISTLLMKAGKTSFKEIASTNPRHIEMIVSRKAPFGSALVDEASHLPEYNVTLEKRAEIAQLEIDLLNPSRLEEKSTVNLDSMMILLVGDSDNNILLYEKYTHSYMIENPQIKRTIKIENQNVDYIRASLISEDWVGIDCESKLELSSRETINKKNNSCKQTFLDIYMKHVKRADTYKKNKENPKSANKNKVGSQEINKTPSADEILHEDQINIQDTQNSTKKAKNPKKKNIKISKSIFRAASKNKHDKKKNKSSKLHNDSLYNFNTLESEGNNTLDFSTFVETSSCKKLQSDEKIRADNVETNVFSPVLNCNDANNKNKKEVSSKNRSDYDTYKYTEEFEISDEKNTVAENNIVSGNQRTIGLNQQNNVDRDANKIVNNNSKNTDINNSLTNVTDDKITFDAPLYGKLCHKYKLPTYPQNVKTEGQNGSSKDVAPDKEPMDNPDSTVENTIFQRHDFFMPQAKKPKKEEHYASAFDMFPQKTIKWRSPLVDSPPEKFSPRKSELCFNFGGRGSGNKEDTRESSDLRLGSQDTNTTSNSMSSTTPFEILEKRPTHSNAPSEKPQKKKPKFQFPLSDQDCMEEENVSFNTEMKQLNALCDPEYFGLSTRPKESTAGKYYSNLLMNSQRKRDQNSSAADEAPSQSKSNTRLSENNVPESQEVFSEDDLAAARQFQFPKPSPNENIPTENNFGNVNMSQSLTQPVPLDYYLDPNSEFSRKENYFAQKPNSDDYINTSFPTAYHPQQKYIFNSQLNEPIRYPVRTSPYFSQPFHERPAELLSPYPVPPPQHPCLCCGHHRAKYPFYEPCIDPHSSWNRHVDGGLPYRAYRVPEVPENYHYLEPMDDRPQSWRFADDRNMNNLAAPSRDFCQFMNPPAPERPHLNPIIQEGISRSSYVNHTNNPRFDQVSSHKPSSDDKKPVQNNNNNSFHDLQTSIRRNVSMFAPTPKPRISHGRPGFNLIRNGKPSIPPRESSSYFQSSVPPNTNRRMLNFNSFEERLDDIIVPRSSGFSFSATRNFDPNSYQSDGGEFMNRFVLPVNNRKGNQ